MRAPDEPRRSPRAERRARRRNAAVLALCMGMWLAAAGATRADWREELGTLRIGLLAWPGAGDTVPGASDIEAAFSRALGVPVTLFVARDFAALIEAHVAGRVDYAVYSAMAYATAWRACGCVEPLAAPRAGDGATGIRSVLVTRAGPARADGRRKLALSQRESVAGHLVPLAEYRLDGLPVSGDESVFVRTASASEAERMFLEGTVDGYFTWIAEREGPGPVVERLREAGLEAGDYHVEWRSGLLRFGPHAVRSDMPEEAKRLLAAFLEGLADGDPETHYLIEENHFGGFERVGHEDYGLAVELVNRAGGTP